MTEKILILDFGSQYTQLIARAVRESNVYCEIIPFNSRIHFTDVKGIILSGSPFSVNQEGSPFVDVLDISNRVPVLGICYGAQLTARSLGGLVEKSDKREYGRAIFTVTENDRLFHDIPSSSQVWMSHSDTITVLPEGFNLLGTTESIPVAAFKRADPDKLPVYGLQFHPEVFHSLHGKKILSNFLFSICSCKADWTPEHFIRDAVASIREQVGEAGVVMGLSGGVDSTVAAMLIKKAIGNRLHGIFIDNGLLRKNEFENVLEQYRLCDIHVIGVEARDHFYAKLAGKIQPEEKRKAIGTAFIEIFEKESRKITDAGFLGQGTIYPDVIESVSVHGPSVTIKSHHNVGGLPEKMNLKLVEPLRMLFKDEVRKIGRELGIPDLLLDRHPFPGPGLGIRIPGEVTEDKVKLLQEADHVFITALHESGLYGNVWQAGAILLPVKTVGVMGDERTYEHAVALRAVSSVDGMTADFSHLPFDFLARVSNDIINRVKGINRVVYDISSKPPATIEWE